MKSKSLLLISVLLISGCVSELPRPVPERSPVRKPERQVFMPLLVKPMNKFGTAGCTPNPAALGASWCYNWSRTPGSIPGVETVAMIYAPSEVLRPLTATSEWIMGFNEPDLRGQSNTTPEGAVEPWAQLEARYPDRPLLSPAPSSNNPYWLAQFRAAFFARFGRYPRLNGLAMHCYLANAAQCITLLDQYQRWARAWGVPEIWVTEFYFAGEDDARAFAAELERRPIVTHWAPYKSHKDCTLGGDHNWNCVHGGDPSLLTADGKITERGRWYARPTPEAR